MLTLRGKLAKLIEEEAKRLDMTPEEYLLELLSRNEDPKDKALDYLEVSKDLLEEAKEELEKGNVRQAAEKLWGSAALAIKAFAYWKDGKRLASHGELWEYKRKLEEEMGDWVSDAWAQANTMYICFYEGWCSRKDVKDAYERVKKLVKEIELMIKRSY